MKNMKKMKRLVALALSVVMVLAMSVFAFADTVKKYTITGPDNGHTYKIYQIFTGEYDATKDVLSNVKWGQNGNGTVGESVSDVILNALTGVNSKTDEEKLTEIKKRVNSNSTAAFEINATTNSVNVPAGYYLIQDTALANQDPDADPVPDAYSTDIVKVVKNLTITPKADVPSFEKKLKDKNDTDGTETSWQDSADYDIGDDIQFKLEGTVASNYADYKHYYFAFHDVEEAGLAFNKDAKVYVDGTEITSGYTVKTAGIEDGCTFEVEFQDLKAINGVKAGSKITVRYTSKLTAQANLGSPGNVNKAKLVFSNNPKNEQVGKPETPGETPWDNVIVFTYKVVVNKVDENGGALTGAEFTLKKKIKGEDGNVTQEPVAVVKNGAGTTFTFSGLDDGEYILEETTTPDGYNTISPITFTVNADHTITWDGTNRDAVLKDLTGNKVSGEITLTKDKAEGSLTTNVVNKKGSSLPSTGGIGTTIFYVVGAILMVGAAVLLITKRRAEN